MFSLMIKGEYGESLSFPDTRRYVLTDVSGLDPPVAELSFTQISGVDGSSFSSGQVGNRNIVLTMTVLPPLEQNRIFLNRIFTLKSKVKICYESESLDVYTYGYVESLSCNAFELGQQATVSVICGNPYFLAQSTSGITFSAIKKKAYVNAGQASTGFEVRIKIADCDVLMPAVTNETTGELIRISDTFKSGDEIVISTVYGKRSITLCRDGAETSLLDKLHENSSWVQLVPGDNILSYSCFDGIDGMSVTGTFRKKYPGV